MINFIEVTGIDNGAQVLIAIDKIVSVVNDGYGVFIEYGTDNDCTSSGIYVSESYNEIKKKLILSEVFNNE